MNNKPVDVLMEIEIKTQKEKEEFLDKFKNFNGRIIAYWIKES